MATGRPLPWSSWAEWEQVGSWLFSGAAEAEAKAISRVRLTSVPADKLPRRADELWAFQISVWRARGRVPLGADLAASLIELRQR